MTTNAHVINANGIAIGSDVCKSFPNEDGTYTTVSGSKITQITSHVITSVAGKGGANGRSISLQLSVAFETDSEGTPFECASKFADKYVEVMQKLGVTASDLTQEFICGSLGAIDNATDDKVLEPFRDLLDTPTTSQCSDALDEVLTRCEKAIKGLPTDPDLAPFDPKQAVTDLLALSGPSLGEHLMKDRGIDYVPTKEQSVRLAQNIADFCTKAIDSRDVSDLLFCGYGPEEYMPSTARLKLYGVVGTQVLHSIEKDDPMETGRLNRVITTAQDSAEGALLYGIGSDDYSATINVACSKVKELFNASEKHTDEFGEKFNEQLGQFFFETYKQPFMRAIGGMDASGLARVADLLCRVQELRSALSSTQATVGGTIEVVTITKNEGVRWLRKLEPTLSASDGSVLG